MREFYLDSKSGGKLLCRVWEPKGRPLATLQIVHGIAEYGARYADFAEFLTEHGILVAAEDHMGHGGSISAEATQGFFVGGWETAVEDSGQLLKWMRETYPEVPYFLLGHSMGSFMARTMLFRFRFSGITGAIISGTGWQPAPVLAAGLAICKLEARRIGEKNTSPLVNKIMFGNYNKGIEPQRTAFDWLCTDDAVVDRYIADPLCGFDASVGLARDMLTGIRMIQQNSNICRMTKDLPVLFIAGKSDPVGNYGKGVDQTVRAFRNMEMKNVTEILYEGRHEVLNEKNKAQVYADVLKFMEDLMLK